MKINEIDIQPIPQIEGGVPQRNIENSANRNEGPEDNLRNEYNSLTLQEKNLQLENNKIQQRIKELKDMSINNKPSILI